MKNDIVNLLEDVKANTSDIFLKLNTLTDILEQPTEFKVLDLKDARDLIRDKLRVTDR